MTIEDIVKARGITEVLHFTTHRGVTGIVATGAVLPRTRLTQEQYLEHIYLGNCPDRSRDREWWGYVNLSLTDINRYLMGISRNRWHPSDVGWWCVLSFAPRVLEHDGVYFSTTNNAYPHVKRGTGAEGLDAMFAPVVKEFDTKSLSRGHGALPSMPTSPQAEVLYPGDLILDHLSCVYVPNDETADKVKSICAACNRKIVDCRVSTDLFV